MARRHYRHYGRKLSKRHVAAQRVGQRRRQQRVRVAVEILDLLEREGRDALIRGRIDAQAGGDR
jgi:hypothetical protein